MPLFRTRKGLTLQVCGGRFHRAVTTGEGTILFLHLIVENRTGRSHCLEGMEVSLGTHPVQPERPRVLTPFSYAVRGLTCRSFDLALLPEVPLELRPGTRAEMIYTGFAAEPQEAEGAEVTVIFSLRGGSAFRSRFQVLVERRNW